MEKGNHVTKQPYLIIVEDRDRLPWIILKTAANTLLMMLNSARCDGLSFHRARCYVVLWSGKQTPNLGSSGIGRFGSVSLPLYSLSVMNLWKL